MRHMSLLFVFLLAPLAPLHSVQEPPDAARIAELRSDAEQGNAEAQYGLGNLYAEGQGVAQDYVEARKWFLKAAEQGRADAQNNLGILYAEGLGVAQDYAMAYVWYNLAAAQGDAAAKKHLDIVAEKLDTVSLARAQTLSNEYFKLYVEPFQ